MISDFLLLKLNQIPLCVLFKKFYTSLRKVLTVVIAVPHQSAGWWYYFPE